MHASSFHEPRLQPLPKTFFDETPSHSGLKRCRSFGGYIPYSLGDVTDEDSCSDEETPFQRQFTCPPTLGGLSEASENKKLSYPALDLGTVHEEVMWPACSPDATSRTLHREQVPRTTCSPNRTPRSLEKALIGRDDCRVKDSDNEDVPYLGPDGPWDLRSPGSSPRGNMSLQPFSPLHSLLDASTHLCATPAESDTEDCISDILHFFSPRDRLAAHASPPLDQIHMRSSTLPEPGPEASPTFMHPSMWHELDAAALSTYPSTPPGVFSIPLVSSVPAPPRRSPISCNAPPTFLLDSCQPICRRSIDLSNALASNAPECSLPSSNDPASSTFSLATLVAPSPECLLSCRKGARLPKQRANYLSSAPSEPLGDLMVETFAKTWASRQECKGGSWASRKGSEECPCPLPPPSQPGPIRRQFSETTSSYNLHQEFEAPPHLPLRMALVDSIQQEADPFPDDSQAVLGDDESVTTLMIRNLPRNITPLCLIRELNQCGFEGTYNFAYLPQSFNTKDNLGFAFVNFIDSSMVSVLIGQWHRQRPFQMTMAQAPLNISPAMVQGLAANLQKWATPRLRRVKNRDLRPFVLDARTKLLRSLTDEECMAGAKNQSSYATSPGHI